MKLELALFLSVIAVSSAASGKKKLLREKKHRNKGGVRWEPGNFDWGHYVRE
jgi:hypothetical protein